MGRLRWPDRVTDRAGNGIVQAACTFAGRDSGNPVKVYPDRLGTIERSQPLYADRNGEVVAYVEESDLPVRVTATLDGWSDSFDWEFPGSAKPSGGAGGVLSGSYPNPGFAVDMATQAELDAAVAGVSHAPTGPAGGDLSGSYPDPQIKAGAVVDADVSAANKDGAAGTPSLRTLGSGGQQAAAGNDARLSDQRTPLDGSVTGPKLAANAVDASKVLDGSLGLGELSASGTPDASKFLRGDNSWAVPAGKALDALSATTPDKAAWEYPAGTDVVEVYGLRTAAGLTLLQRDDFDADSTASYGAASAGTTGKYIWSSTLLTTSGAGSANSRVGMLAPSAWGNADDQAKIRARGRFPVSAGSSTSVVLGFIAPGSTDLTTSAFGVEFLGNGNPIGWYNNIGSGSSIGSWSASPAVNTYYVFELTRAGDSYTASVKDAADSTVLFTTTQSIPAGANRTAYGAGVALRPFIASYHGSSQETQIDWFEFYATVPESRDLFLAVTPSSGSRTAKRLYGSSGSAFRSDFMQSGDAAGGDLGGTYPNPTLKVAAVDSSKVLDGSLALADLSATGTKDATTYLRGDNTWANPAAGGVGDTLVLDEPFSTDLAAYTAILGTSKTGLVVSGGVLSTSDANDHAIAQLAIALTEGKLVVKVNPNGSSAYTVALGKYVDASNYVGIQLNTAGTSQLFTVIGGSSAQIGTGLGVPGSTSEPFWLVLRYGNTVSGEVHSIDPRHGVAETNQLRLSELTAPGKSAFGKGVTGRPYIRLAGPNGAGTTAVTLDDLIVAVIAGRGGF